MKPVEVLYLSYDGMTDPLGQSQVIPYLAGLSKEGFHFHLLSFEKKENYDRDKDLITSLLKDHAITWHPLSYTKNPPVLSTISDLSRMKKSGLELIRKHDIKIVHCRSYISALAGMYLKEKTGVKFLFDMRGFWADERVDGGLWNLKNPIYNFIYKFFKKQEKILLREADAVISLTENAKREINSWHLRNESRSEISVIPCCADLHHFNPENVNETEKEKLKSQLNIPDNAIVISYLGAIGTWYLLDEMLEFFKLFLDKHSTAIFLFITREPEEIILQRSNVLGIPKSALRIYSANRSQVPVALSLCRASIFFIKPAYSKKASSPTKQGEIMGMGLPVICNTGIGDTDFVVNKYSAGICINLNDKSSLKKAVDEFENLKKISSDKIIKGAEDFYSLESGVKKYLGVYREMLIREEMIRDNC